MQIEIYTNRNVYKEGNAGTIKENNAEIIEFKFPEKLKEYKKYIEIETEGLKIVDIIEDNKYVLRNNITKNNMIKAQVVLKDLEKGIIFKSNVFDLRFRESLNLSENLEETNEGLLDKTLLELQKVQENIKEYTNILNTKQDKEQGKELTSNNFTNEQKEKLESLENYNDTEIKTNISKLESNLEMLQNENTNIKNELKTKVEQIEGKNLSENDFTNEEKQKLESLENYNDTNVKERISILEVDNTTNQQEIENIKQKDMQQETKIETNIENLDLLQKENIELKEECERLKEDLKVLPSITEEGKKIKLKDTIETRFQRFEIKGNSHQEKTKQIETEMVNAAIVGGPMIVASELGRVAILKAKPNVTYKISRNVKTSRFRICESEEEWNKINSFNCTNQKEIERLEGDYTTSGTGNYMYIFCWYSSSGDTTNNIPDIKVLVETPSKEYPAEIKTVTEKVKIKIHNKNLLNLGKLHTSEYISQKEDEIKLDFTQTTGNNFYINLFNNLQIPKGNYVLSWKVNGTFLGGNLMIFHSDGTREETPITSRTSYPLLEKDIDKINFYYVANVTNCTIQIQIEEGEIATEYERYQKQRYDIPIQQEMLEEDKIEKIEGKWKEKHHWRKVENYQGESITSEYKSTTGGLTTGATIYYKVEPYYLEGSKEQEEILEKMEKTAKSYKGTTYIESLNETKPILKIEARKEIESKTENRYFKEKIINFIGDSITYGYDGGGNGSVEKNYPSIVKELLGCKKCNNYGVNGSTITGNETIGTAPINIRYANMEDNAQYVMVFAGTNDHGQSMSLGSNTDTNNTTFYGSLEVLIQGLINKYPTARISFITPIKKINIGANTNGKTLEEYANAIKEKCRQYSIPVLDFYHESGCVPQIQSFKENNLPDGLHPNQEYYYILAEKIAKFIENL